MSEYKKQVGIAVTVALVGALSLATFASLSFPLQPSPSTFITTQSTSTSAAANASIPMEGIVFSLAGELSAQNVSCSLASGACTLTIVNTSATPLELESCQMTIIARVDVTSTVTFST